MSDFASKFTPYNFSPRQLALMELQKDMRETINDYALLYAQTLQGINLLGGQLEKERETRMAEMVEAFGEEEAKRIYGIVSQLFTPFHAAKDLGLAPAHGTLDSFVADAKPNSKHLQTLTHSILISLYQYWEHTWRSGIEDIVGFPIGSDFWGEVCKLRDCILHNKGRTDKAYERRAKILCWFKQGDPIVVTDKMFSQFIGEAMAYCEKFVIEDFQPPKVKEPPRAPE